MSPPQEPDIRGWLHSLREPLSALSIQIELLEGEALTVKGQAGVKSMRASMDRAKAVFEDFDFLLQNGHPQATDGPKEPPVPPPHPPRSTRARRRRPT
jgi:hypothetical protein